MANLGAAGGEGCYSLHFRIRWLNRASQVGPTILFECPAQIPRSALRSFSLWARHSAETSAERNVRLGAARSEDHTTELHSLAYIVCRLLLEKKEQWAARVEGRYTIQTCTT